MNYETLHKLLESGKETVAVRVINDCRQNHEYAHITLQVVHVAKSGQYDTFGFYDNYYDQKNQYKGLMLTCQMDPSKNEPYAFHVGIRPDREMISQESAESAAKVLKSINRKMVKMSETEGHVKDFSEFAMRFCRAIKAKAFYTNVNGNRQQSINHNIGLLRSELDALVKENNAILSTMAA